MTEIVPLIPLASALAILFILAYTIGQRKNDAVNRAFILLFADLFLLTFLEYLFRTFCRHPAAASAILHTITVLAAFNGFLLLNAVWAMTHKKRSALFWFWGILAFATGMTSLLPGLSIASVAIINQSPVITPTVIFFGVVVLAVLLPEIHAVISGFAAFRRVTDARIKREFLYLFAGTILAALVYFTFLIVLPYRFHWFHGTDYTSLGIMIFALVLFRAISKYKFLSHDIDQIQRVSQRLFANMRDAVVLFDEEGTVIQANDAACALFGTPPGALRRERIENQTGEYRVDAQLENRMTLSPEPSPPLPPDEQFSRIRRSRELPHHRGAGNSDS